jgi:hypothetical protein
MGSEYLPRWCSNCYLPGRAFQVCPSKSSDVIRSQLQFSITFNPAELDLVRRKTTHLPDTQALSRCESSPSNGNGVAWWPTRGERPPDSVHHHHSSRSSHNSSQLPSTMQETVHVDREEVAPNDTQAAAPAHRRAQQYLGLTVRALELPADASP